MKTLIKINQRIMMVVLFTLALTLISWHTVPVTVLAADTEQTIFNCESNKAAVEKCFIAMFENNIAEAKIVFPDGIEQGKLRALAASAYRDARYSNPEIANYTLYNCGLSVGQQSTGETYCKVRLTVLEKGYERKAEAIKMAQAFLDQLYAKGIINQDMPEYNRAKLIANNLRKIITYEIKDDYSTTAWSAFSRGTSTCQGYTSAYNLVLKLDGIQCKGIAGKTSQGSHMWTVAILDNNEYHIDITWGINAGIGEQEMTNRHNQ